MPRCDNDRNARTLPNDACQQIGVEEPAVNYLGTLDAQQPKESPDCAQWPLSSHVQISHSDAVAPQFSSNWRVACVEADNVLSVTHCLEARCKACEYALRATG